MRRATLRARYCAEVERLAVAQLPALAGRMDWDTVLHLMFANYTASEAADRIVNLSIR